MFVFKNMDRDSFFMMVRDNGINSGEYYNTSIGNVFVLRIGEGHIDVFSYNYGFIALNLFFLVESDNISDLIYMMFHIDCEESLKLWKVLIMISKNIHVCNSKKLVKNNIILNNREFNFYSMRTLSSTYKSGSFVCPVCGNTDVDKINIELFKDVVNDSKIIFDPIFNGCPLSPHRVDWGPCSLSKYSSGKSMNNTMNYIINKNMYNNNDILITDFIKLYPMFKTLMCKNYINKFLIQPIYTYSLSTPQCLLSNSKVKIDSNYTIIDLINLYIDNVKRKRDVKNVKNNKDEVGCLGCYIGDNYNIYHYERVDIINFNPTKILYNNLPVYDPPKFIISKARKIFKEGTGWTTHADINFLIHQTSAKIYLAIKINCWDKYNEKLNINPHDWRGFKKINKIDENFIYDTLLKHKISCSRCNSPLNDSYSHIMCPNCGKNIKDSYNDYLNSHPSNKISIINYGGIKIV